MSTFECKVHKLKIEEHPNADALELAIVGDYRTIVRKGQFTTGDLGVYIPEASIVPEWLIKELGLEGKLAGKDKNRVKAVRLRGIVSQGLIVPLVQYPFTTLVEVEADVGEVIGVSRLEEDGSTTIKFAPEGTDVTDFLGITKYEPPIPVHMAGEVFNAHGYTLNYDIENFKRFPDVLVEGEEVTMTEKLHGTWCCFGYHPDIDVPIITSKGLSSKGVAFKLNDNNADNLYVTAFQREITRDVNEDRLFEMFVGTTILDRAKRVLFGANEPTPFYILGEIIGVGVQDLHYGIRSTEFRIFDVYVGHPNEGQYLDDEYIEGICEATKAERVPVLYRGPFSREKMLEVTDGKESVSGKETNIREGVVITPREERWDNELGRVKLKSVSDDYIFRKNGTEYN